MEYAFENDIIKSTEDFSKALIDVGYQSRDKEINNFFIGISNSRFKNLNKVYEIIFENLKTRDNRFKFYNLLKNNNDIRIAKINYGKILISEYGKTQLSNSEQIITEEIISLENEILLEIEEINKKEEKKQKKK